MHFEPDARMKAVYNLEEALIDALGHEALCEALLQALSTDQLEELLPYIARMYDVATED